MPQHQFTIRGLMIAVAIVAGSLAVALNHAELLPLLVGVGIPLGGLIGLLRRVPPDRPGWRVGVHAAMLGWLILGGGWLWAEAMVWWMRRERLSAVGRWWEANYNNLGWVGLPLGITAFCLVSHVVGLARFCTHRRQRAGCLFVFGYAALLAFAYVFLFGALVLEAYR